MEQKKILLIEDDPEIGNLMKIYLEANDFKIYLTDNGEKALEIFESMPIQLIILDIMLPKQNGFELIKIFREKSIVPIIVVSGRDKIADKITGLTMGADDYLVKPFEPLELVARVQAKLDMVNRINSFDPGSKNELCIGDICLDQNSMNVTKNGKRIDLTPTEYKILTILMKNPRQVFSKLQLYHKIYGSYYEGDDKTMMVHICRLREKLEDIPEEPRYIKTIRGLGYRIEDKKG